jgi:hypothetical protein
MDRKVCENAILLQLIPSRRSCRSGGRICGVGICRFVSGITGGGFVALHHFYICWVKSTVKQGAASVGTGCICGFVRRNAALIQGHTASTAGSIGWCFGGLVGGSAMICHF